LTLAWVYKSNTDRRLIEMEINKKHILKSYKNEQEEIDSIEKIKDEKDHPVNSSISGYNVEKNSIKEYPANAFSPGELDMGEPAFKDYEDDPKENPVAKTYKNKDIDRPLPERAMNNRVR
jgi:hypothetical protein